MAISREVIDTIRERVDLVQLVQQTVTLKKKGGRMVGLCPFHQEKTPSFGGRAQEHLPLLWLW